MTDYVIAPPAQPALAVQGTDKKFPVRRIWCVGRNYIEHIREMGQDERAAPFFFAKPADADDVVAALLAPEGRKPDVPENPMSVDRVRWEHIQRIYELCGRNTSETARRLNMHRRTLQRILAKRAPH